MGASAPVSAKEYTVVVDIETPEFKKSYSSNDAVAIGTNIIDPIIKKFTAKFAQKMKAAKAKIASTNIAEKFDGYIVQVLYGSDLTKQKEYEDFHEKQFGRKSTQSGSISSVFAY